MVITPTNALNCISALCSLNSLFVAGEFPRLRQSGVWCLLGKPAGCIKSECFSTKQVFSGAGMNVLFDLSRPLIMRYRSKSRTATVHAASVL
jgi:hypothetical protein